MTSRKNAPRSKRRIQQNKRLHSLALWISVLAVVGLIAGGVFLYLLAELCRVS